MTKLFKRLILTALVLSALLTFMGCGNGATDKADENSSKINIVTTNFPPYDFAKHLAGDLAEVTMLLSPGQESHTFEPSPLDIIKIQNADIFIMGGGTSDEWAKKLISSSQTNNTQILSMMDCVDVVTEEITEGMTDNHHEKNDHSKFYEYDEHVWTSPVNAIKICEKITELLILEDSENTEIYTENSKSYIAQLRGLDKSFSDVLLSSKRQTLVFGDRFPFRYFADQYGISYFAAFPGCSGETEPDAQTVKFLIDKINNEKIPVILYTELSNQKIADALSEATGAKKALFHSCHSITKDEWERGETYISLMHKNVSVLKEALL